jgi:hypothetical protein
MIESTHQVWPQLYKTPRCPREQSSAFIINHSVLSSLLSHFSNNHCTGYRSVSLSITLFITVTFINFRMLVNILLVALAASPLVAAHGKVSVVVSHSSSWNQQG